MWFIEYCLKVKTRMVVRVSVVYPCDHKADWQLLLTATAQNHEWGCATYDYAEKTSKFKVRILLNAWCFLTILKS